ncbi:MAG: flagellar basal body P-ring formation chaperone FlgA [Alphaproteobacteria bacterium]
MMPRARHLIVATLLTAITWGLATEAMAGPTPVLRKDIVVEGDVILLGDLFEGTGTAAQTVVAYTPQPGRRAVFDANWLSRLAQEHGLPWRAQSRLDRVTVERATNIVAHAEIEDALRAELALRGYGAEYELSLNNATLSIHVPTEQAATIGIESLSIQERSERMTAVLRIPADDPSARRINVTGRFFAVLDIPVLAHVLQRGSRIGEGDIVLKQFRASTIRGNIITDPASMVGLAPRRALSAGMPIAIAELGQPLLVRRGRPVTMTFQNNNMTLTATGRALDDGSHGDLVQIQNTKTLKTIDAVVTGSDRVAVGVGGQLAMNVGAAR